MNTAAADRTALVPLVDADVLCYRVGFAAEKDEPIENVLHSVKKCVLDIMSTFPNAPDERLFLTGKGNFRNKVATQLEYKGHRKHMPKPQYYEEIREYLQRRFNAEVVDGMEADDALGINQYSKYKATSVIASIDKDMLMIPGWHYNFVKKELRYVNKDAAYRAFFMQLLMGDMTDNIPGIRGLGPKTAAKLLGDETDPEKMYEIAQREYERHYGDEWRDVIDEQAQLLWILRSETEGCPFMSGSTSAWCPKPKGGKRGKVQESERDAVRASSSHDDENPGQ